MLMATSEASESVLAWSWVIEALASCRVVDLDVLRGLIGANPNLSDNLRKEAREMVALLCLEALFDPAKMPKNGVFLPCNQKEFRFDSSECFTGVLQRVLEQTSVSDLGKSSSNPLVNLREGASDQLVREVNAFIEYRKSSMPKSALEQLRDRIQRADDVSLTADLSKVCRPEAETHSCNKRNRRLEEISPNESLVCSKRDRGCMQNEKPVKDHPTDARSGKSPPRKKLRRDEAVASEGAEMSKDATERKVPQTEPEVIESSHEMSTGRRMRLEGDKAGLVEKSQDKVANQHEGTSFVLLMAGNSSVLPDSEELDVCMKCKEGGEVLVCSASGCQMVIHEGCLGFSPSTDSRSDFLCPFCACSAALREYDEAKRKMLLARAQLSLFIGGNPGPSPRLLDQPKGLSNKNVHPSRHGKEAAMEKKVVSVDRNSSLKFSSREEEKGKSAKEQQNEEGPREMNVEQFQYAGSCGDNPKLRHRQRSYVPSKNASCASRGENGNSEARSRKANPSGNDSRPSSQHTTEASIASLDHFYGTLQGEKCRSSPSKYSLRSQSQQKLADEERNASGSAHDDSDEISEEENCKAIGPKYFVRPQGKKISYHNLSTSTFWDRRIRVSWLTEEVEMLKEGVRRFASGNMKVIPWKTILEFGNSVFWRGRTTVDLKDKWRNMVRQGLVPG